MADPKDSPAKVEADTSKAAKKEEAKSDSASKQASEKDADGNAPHPGFGSDSDKQIGRGGGTTAAQYDELAELGVNPQIDNRTGDQRPRLDPVLKPQQIDGPEIGGLAVDASELADKGRKADDGRGDWKVLGSKAEGPIGRGEGVESEGVNEPDAKFGGKE